MATAKQTKTALKNVTKAPEAANLPGRSRMGRDELAHALGEIVP
jgi:hypothetical protein